MTISLGRSKKHVKCNHCKSADDAAEFLKKYAKKKKPRMRNRRRMKNQKRSSLSHPRFDSNELTLRVLQMHGALGLMRKIGGPKAAAELESGSEEEEQSSSEEEQELSESEEGEESVEEEL